MDGRDWRNPIVLTIDEHLPQEIRNHLGEGSRCFRCLKPFLEGQRITAELRPAEAEDVLAEWKGLTHYAKDWFLVHSWCYR